MFKILFSLLLFTSLYSVDYSTFYESLGHGYKHSGIDISGKFSSYNCSHSDSVSRSFDDFCRIELKVFKDATHFNYVSLTVGTSWESDFKSASLGDTFSFSCIYRGGSLSRFKNCN